MLDFTTLHGWLRAGHIIPGFIGLAAFWIPIFSKKGGRLHILSGKLFVWCAAVVILSAITSCIWGLADPVGFAGRTPKTEEGLAAMSSQIRFFTAFLGALAVYTLVPLWIGVRTIRTRSQPQRIGNIPTRLLIVFQKLTGLAAMAFGVYRGVTENWSFFEAVLIGLGAVGVYAAGDEWRFLRDYPTSRMAWWYKHMECMLTTGIAFHTAFLVFGLNRLIGEYLTGPWAIVPWVVPTAIGVPAITIWTRHYRRKFNECDS